MGHNATADDIAANWTKISNFDGAKHFTQGGEQTQKLFAKLQEKPVVG